MTRSFSDTEKLKCYHLRSLGLSNYTIRQITSELPFTLDKQAHQYLVSDLKQAITQRLQNPKLKPQTRQSLHNAQNLLTGKSNVIQVDFLRNVPLDEKIRLLHQQNTTLFEEEQELRRRTEAVLHEARQAIG